MTYTPETMTPTVEPTAPVPATHATEPMRYTGDGTPDMAVDYIPGDDPGSVANQDTRETVNTM